VDAERVAVGADAPDKAIRVQAGQRRGAASVENQPGVYGQVVCLGHPHGLALVQLVKKLGRDREISHPGPAGVDGELGPVLLGVEADRRRLDAHREVLADEHDRRALGTVVERHREDPRVVVAQPEAGGQHHRVGVVELDLERAAVGVDGYR